MSWKHKFKPEYESGVPGDCAICGEPEWTLKHAAPADASATEDFRKTLDEGISESFDRTKDVAVAEAHAKAKPHYKGDE